MIRPGSGGKSFNESRAKRNRGKFATVAGAVGPATKGKPVNVPAKVRGAVKPGASGRTSAKNNIDAELRGPPPAKRRSKLLAYAQRMYVRITDRAAKAPRPRPRLAYERGASFEEIGERADLHVYEVRRVIEGE